MIECTQSATDKNTDSNIPFQLGIVLHCQYSTLSIFFSFCLFLSVSHSLAFALSLSSILPVAQTLPRPPPLAHCVCAPDSKQSEREGK